MPDPTNRLALIPALIVALALIVLITLVIVVGRDPVIDALSPEVVSPGDEVIVMGRSFGPTPGALRLGGRELPSSSVLEWTDERIGFVVPRDADSGLLYVIGDRGRSEGVLVRVEDSIPVTSFSGEGPGAPVIEDISASELLVGQVLTLSGANFGRARRNSRVAVPMEGGVGCVACDHGITYAFWSDSRIVMRLPSGATSGFLSVVTAWGASNPIRVIVERPAGAVIAENPVEIALRYGARIDDVVIGDPERSALPGERDIVVRLPVLTESRAQRSVRYLDGRGQPSRFDFVDASFEREIRRTTIARRYALRLNVDPAAASSSYEADTGFFEHYTRSLPGIPVDDARMREVAARLRGNRASPYRIAEAAYLFTLDSLVYAPGVADRGPLAGLESGVGDDYTYAMLFVTALRSALVPARPVGGVLVTEDLMAYTHFWAEFFVTGIGWIPVDPALGDGAFPSGFPVPEEPRTFYFGNLDNRRVAFYHGYDASSPTYLDGLSRVPADPYTVQRSYAEGGAGIESFGLTWYVPRVIGLYSSD